MAAVQQLFGIVPLFLFACFSPDLSKRTLRCDLENPCPDGLSCVSGLCGQSDGIDASSSDQAPPDMKAMGPSRCAAGGGTSLGAAWACPALLGGTNPPASQRCAAGSIPCTNASGIDLAGCKTLPGFFVANYVGRHTSGATVTCMSPNGTKPWNLRLRYRGRHATDDLHGLRASAHLRHELGLAVRGSARSSREQ
jgi:hypothetical protein